jgi:uncharacterized membrane protein
VKKLNPRGQRWLKSLHVLFASVWVGAAVVLGAKQFFVNPSDGGELYGILSTMNFVDYFVIIPGAVGILLTGIVYSVWTNWGWFKHKWILVKWIICIYGIAFGTYPLGPWLDGLVDRSKEQGLRALSDPSYVHNEHMLRIFGTFQILTLIFAIFISVLKPWEQKERTKSTKKSPG